MSYRIPAGSSLRFLACAAALAMTRPLAAQEPRVIISGGGDKVSFATLLTAPLSDEAIRAMILAHLPEELRQDEPRHIVLVVDANDQYVTSKATKAMVVSHDSGSNVVVIGDTTGVGGPVIIRRTTTNNSSDTPAAISVFSTKMGDESGGVFGSGYSTSEVSVVGLRRYAAGQLGINTILVSVVKLK